MSQNGFSQKQTNSLAFSPSPSLEFPQAKNNRGARQPAPPVACESQPRQEPQNIGKSLRTPRKSEVGSTVGSTCARESPFNRLCEGRGPFVFGRSLLYEVHGHPAAFRKSHPSHMEILPFLPGWSGCPTGHLRTALSCGGQGVQHVAIWMPGVATHFPMLTTLHRRFSALLHVARLDCVALLIRAMLQRFALVLHGPALVRLPCFAFVLLCKPPAIHEPALPMVCFIMFWMFWL